MSRDELPKKSRVAARRLRSGEYEIVIHIPRARIKKTADRTLFMIADVDEYLQRPLKVEGVDTVPHIIVKLYCEISQRKADRMVFEESLERVRLGRPIAL